MADNDNLMDPGEGWERGGGGERRGQAHTQLFPLTGQNQYPRHADQHITAFWFWAKTSSASPWVSLKAEFFPGALTNTFDRKHKSFWLPSSSSPKYLFFNAQDSFYLLIPSLEATES